LNSVDNTKPTKVIVANTLGQEYPEGVSQESFTQSDENGLMTSIITRRVVVINGQGNVYVRTQTLNSITYTKNGEASTEYVWQKETQSSKLERHF
jgi:epidermal growth factor receptor substrate 15